MHVSGLYGEEMSRFPIRHPFYDKMERDLAEERMKRILAIPVRYGNCHEVPKTVSYADAIFDHDPGDEDKL